MTDSTGWSLSDIGHGLLDITGLVPGVGEAADLTNAVWYASEGNYLDAGLSLLSVIPIVGDVIGKGGKLLTKLGPNAAAQVLEAIRKVDVPAFLAKFKGHPTLGPYISKIEEALKKWQDDLEKSFGGKKAGDAKEPCPPDPKEAERKRKADQLDKNRRDGLNRETQVRDELEKEVAESGGRVLEQRTLRDANGKALKAADGVGRRPDFFVLDKNGNITKLVEVTSEKAPKALQLGRQEELLSNPKMDVFIRDPVSKKLIKVPRDVIQQTRRLP